MSNPHDDPSPSLLDDFAPEVASGVLTTSLLVLVASIVILIVVMIWAHVSRVGRRRRVERILEPLRPRLLALAADEAPTGSDGNESGREEPGTGGTDDLRGRNARIVDRAVLDLLSKVRGGAAIALVDVLDRHGTVDGALRGTRSLFPTTRARSARVLGATRRAAHAPTLAGLLADRDRAVRSTAVRALGAIGDATYSDAVLRAVRDTDGSPGVPFYIAADALLAMGTDVREAIRRGLDDPDAGVRYVAATVAARGGMATVLPRVLQLFRSDTDESVRIAAAHALGAIGDGRVITDLGRGLDPHEPEGVRRAAAMALGELGAPASLELLRSVLPDPDRRLARVAATALSTLGRAGEKVLVEALEGGTLPPEVSVAEPGSLPAADLSALAGLGAVTAIGIRDRRPDLYALATDHRQVTQAMPDTEPPSAEKPTP